MLSIAGVGILVLAIVFMLAPTIGGQMETAMPALGASSNWNSTYNTGLKTGPDVWEQLKIAVSMFAITIMGPGSLQFAIPDRRRARYPGSNHHLCPQGSLWRRIDVPV
jgi:hypothetical protein